MANGKAATTSEKAPRTSATKPARPAAEEPARPAAEEPAAAARRFETLSGIPVKALYTEADLPAAAIGSPGQYPYTRGLHPEMYRTRLWTMRQFAGFGTAENTNQRFHYLLAQGMTGLSTAFDMPTLMGYDPDHPMSLGEVGREGVAISSLEDM